VTYFSGEFPQLPGRSAVDGVTLLDVTRRAVPLGGLPAAGLGPSTVTAPTTEAMRQPAAAIIQRCYRWLEAAVPMLPQVAALAPVLVIAVQQYAAQQYAACLTQATALAYALHQVCAAIPALPPL